MHYCTSSAAVLMNCLAGSLQIAGMARTQDVSVGRRVVFLVMTSKACSLKNLMDSLKTARSEYDLPVVSFIFIFLGNTWAK